jgi:hypothetical protein
MDSIIPDICGEPRGALPLPFWNEVLVKNAFPAVFETVKKGEYKESDIIVGTPPFPLATDLEVQLLGTLRPTRFFRWMNDLVSCPIYLVCSKLRHK